MHNNGLKTIYLHDEETTNLAAFSGFLFDAIPGLKTTTSPIHSDATFHLLRNHKIHGRAFFGTQPLKPNANITPLEQ